MVAVVSVACEDKEITHAVPAAGLAGALGTDVGALSGMKFLAVLRETPEAGQALSGFRRLPVVVDSGS